MSPRLEHQSRVHQLTTDYAGAVERADSHASRASQFESENSGLHGRVAALEDSVAAADAQCEQYQRDLRDAAAKHATLAAAVKAAQAEAGQARRDGATEVQRVQAEYEVSVGRGG